MTQMFRFERVATPLDPRQVFKDKLLDGMQLTQAQLARAIGISKPRLNMILKGRCQISPEIALRIEKVFDIPAQYWLRVRNEYELFEQRQRMSRVLEELPQRSAGINELSRWRALDWQAAA